MVRQATVFLILFSFGGALKSIIFNDLNFTPQDCIGASITVSILMYMEIYKTETFYEKFLTFGNRSKSVTVFLLSSGLILSLSLILCIKAQFLPKIADYYFSFENLSASMRSIFLFLLVLPVYSFSYLFIAVGFFMITIPILRIISIKVFDSPAAMKEKSEEKIEERKE